MNNKKVLLIVLPIVIIFILLAGVATVAALYFFTDLFKTPQQLFFKYMAGNSKIVSYVSNDNYIAQQQLKETGSYTTQGDLELTFESEQTEQPISMNIETSARKDANTGRYYADATIKNDEEDLLTVSYINDGDVYAIQWSEIYQYYVGFRNSNLKEFARNMGMTEYAINSIPDSIDFDALNTEITFTEEEIQHIVDTYSNVFLQTIPEETYTKGEKQTITINGTNYEADVYSLTLNGELLKQISINLLNTIKNDTTTIQILNNKFNTDGSNLIDQTTLTEKIDEIVTDLQSTTFEDTVTINVYASESQTIKTELMISNGDNITIEYLNNGAIISVTDSGTDDDSMTSSSEPFTMQVKLSKTTQGVNTSNTIEIIPNTQTPDMNFAITQNLGSIQNGTVSNSSQITINYGEDLEYAINEIYYNETITQAQQVEEIQELSNSNTVIANNYPVEQLAPFLESLVTQAGETLETKIMSLGEKIYAIPMIPIMNAYIYNKAENTISNSNLSEQVVAAYNAQFLNYEREMSGSMVRTLCQTVISHNLTAEDYTKLVNVQTTTAQNISSNGANQMTDVTSFNESINQIRNNIQPGKRYNVDFGYDEEGYIVAIGIIEMNA